MKLYLSTIGVSAVLITAINLACNTATWYYVTVAVIWCIALQFAFDGSIAIIINKIPGKYIGVDNRHYFVSEREVRLYKRLQVRRWKDKVWELGGLGGFSKKTLAEPNSPEYIERFIIECNKGVLVHRLSYVAGFLAMLTLPNVCALTIALPVAVINVFLNILPTLALRYNTPMLKNALKRLKAKEANKSDKRSVSSIQSSIHK